MSSLDLSRVHVHASPAPLIQAAIRCLTLIWLCGLRCVARWGVRTKTWTGQMAIPRLLRCAAGLRPPSEIGKRSAKSRAPGLSVSKTARSAQLRRSPAAFWLPFQFYMRHCTSRAPCSRTKSRKAPLTPPSGDSRRCSRHQSNIFGMSSMCSTASLPASIST